MKKRDLLLAGLVLFNVSAFAQGVEVPRYKDDAKVIYEQKFEGSKDWQTIDLNLKPAPLHPNWHIPLYTWNINPVDSIKQVEYYVKADENKQLTADIYDGSGKFEIAGTRDTVMYLYDGVMRTDASFADDSCLQWDTQYIEDHTNATQKGETGIPGKSGSEYGLDRYGEDGGAQFFRYISATSRGVSNRGGGSGGWNPSHDEASESQDHYVPEYRRNLFVRNIPIEDSTSYRLTVFVKPTLNAVKQKGVKARIGVDLMRGYFHSEKSFQVNREGSSKVAFADKTDFSDLEVDKWNKITLMAYYTNDSLGDASAYDQTYYWNNDWDWNVVVDANGKVDATGKDSVTLRYIKQPDKYFVRLSFRSDSTTFDVDNLSLTKSWIGGVEYFQDMLRVDLGYETNLGKLTKEAQAKTNIPAVEIPGENFKIYGLYQGEWEPVPMLSAEYHGDGFMYAWTEPWDYDPETGDGDPRYFNEYDSVLVTFYNPVDAALELKYTGSRYPNGMNKEWIADAEKRRVFDFHNEIAYLNPTITISPVTKEPVSSLKDLAPVFQSAEIENGAFGLDPNRREFTFKFSRNLSFDNLGEDGPANSDKTIVEVIGSNGKEFWDIKDYEEDGVKGLTTIVRRSEYTDPLAGDYTVSFRKVTHSPNPNPESKQDYGDPVTVNYHFGDFNTEYKPITYFKTNWNVPENETESVPLGTARIDHDNKTYKEGDGKKTGSSRMYRQSDAGQANCTFYLAPRGNDTDAQFYIGVGDDKYSINLEKDVEYQISFFALGWDNKAETNLYIFPKPTEGTPADVNNDEKIKLGTFTPTNSVPNADGRKADYVIKTADALSYKFTVPATGKYIVEFRMPKSAEWTGTLYSDIAITAATSGLSDASVGRINSALDEADKAIAAADDAKYRGADYNNLVTVKGEGDGFIAAKVASKINLPSEYENEAKSIDAATSALKLHMDTVDAFYKALADAEKKLAIYADSLKDYALLVVVGNLQDVVDDYFTYDCSKQAPGQIAADTKRLTDAIAAVDARQALIDEFNSAVKAAKVVMENPLAVNYAVLYDNLKDILDTADGFDAVSAEDEELKSITGQLNSAKDDLQTMIDGAEALLARIKALDNLAKSVKANYGDASDEIADRIANITSDDEDLAKIMKSAIKLAIYDNIVNKGDTAVNLDVTGFIRNFNLYATPKIVERTDLKANSSGAKNADPDGANIQHVQHQWNGGDLNGQQPIWIMIEENNINDLYPGWTVYAYAAGNCMVTPDDDTYGKLKEGVALFDGQLAMDWNGKADLKTTVEDLPLGKYNLSVTLKQNTGSGTVLSATALDDTLGLVEYKGDTKSVNNIVVGDGNLNINFTLTSGSGWSQADNFKLTYYADTLFDYTSLLTEAKNEFDNIITVVDFAQIEAAGEYEYYTLNWIKVETPEKGQVYFRKNGNVVEKVIFK